MIEIFLVATPEMGIKLSRLIVGQVSERTQKRGFQSFSTDSADDGVFALRQISYQHTVTKSQDSFDNHFKSLDVWK
jgi:hypothetical protein